MFLHLKPTTMEPCSLDWTDFESTKNSWFCRGCNWVYPNKLGIDVNTSIDCLKNRYLTFLNGTGLVLAHKGLLSLLPVDLVEQGFNLGNVRSRDGRSLDTWRSMNAINRIIVRGTKNVSFRVCEACGRNVYFAQGTPYVFQSQIEGKSIFGTDSYGILIDSKYVDCKLLAMLKGVDVETVDSRNDSLDGLNQLPWSTSTD
jgi:hypothetical protein